MSLNKVTLIGRLGADPETKNVGGNYLASLSIATSEKWKDKDGQPQEKTEWHRISFWGKQAELAAKYLSKGREVYVEGSLQTRSWDDDQGVKRYATDIRGNKIVFLSGGDEKSATSRGDESTSASNGSVDSFSKSHGVANEAPVFDSNEELPF